MWLMLIHFRGILHLVAVGSLTPFLKEVTAFKCRVKFSSLLLFPFHYLKIFSSAPSL